MAAETVKVGEVAFVKVPSLAEIVKLPDLLITRSSPGPVNVATPFATVVETVLLPLANV